MSNKRSTYNCPLCSSLLSQSRYYEIIGAWEARSQREKTLKSQLQQLRGERQKLLAEKRQIRQEMQQRMKAAVRSALNSGARKEKARADRLAKSMQGKMVMIEQLNSTIKELREQLEKGTTPQLEGLNLEAELAKELRQEFPGDKIEHYGKSGDILQRVLFRRKDLGSILYECKKTAKFNKAFIDQTKRAMAARQATYGILVTTVSKKNTAGFWVEKDILIVHPYGATFLAGVLRNALVDIHCAKGSRADMERRSVELMEYIQGDDFLNCVRDSIYHTQQLTEMLQKEAEQHNRVWKDRHGHYKKIHDNVSRISAVTGNIVRGHGRPSAQPLAFSL